jgi:hypothetical protein
MPPKLVGTIPAGPHKTGPMEPGNAEPWLPGRSWEWNTHRGCRGSPGPWAGPTAPDSQLGPPPATRWCRARGLGTGPRMSPWMRGGARHAGPWRWLAMALAGTLPHSFPVRCEGGNAKGWPDWNPRRLSTATVRRFCKPTFLFPRWPKPSLSGKQNRRPHHPGPALRPGRPWKAFPTSPWQSRINSHRCHLRGDRYRPAWCPGIPARRNAPAAIAVAWKARLGTALTGDRAGTARGWTGTPGGSGHRAGKIPASRSFGRRRCPGAARPISSAPIWIAGGLIMQ